jgi:membrane protein YdbS with pleckstrin-like domain
MEEVLPVLAGLVVGLVLHPMKSRVLRSILVLVASVGFGALAAWVSGELAISPVYVAIDAAQAAVAAILTAMLVTAWRRRQLRTRS